MPKIVIVGAGSASFGPSILGDLFSYPIHLRDSEIWLVDTDTAALDLIGRYAGLAMGGSRRRSERLPPDQ